MNIFDAEIISFLNQFSHRSWTFDYLVSFISGNQLLKGGVLVSLLWWLWFKYEGANTQSRECVRPFVFKPKRRTTMNGKRTIIVA